MKLSKHFAHCRLTPAVLAWIFPLLLLLPNIALAFTERDPLISKVTDLVLPLGIYYLLMSLSTAVGRTVIFALPLIILAAFQIVLLHLYGESIIAIDMFLNVATTNVKEVSELLGNLIIAIVIVVIIYLPPIVLAIIQIIGKQRCNPDFRRKMLPTGGILTAVGLICLTICYFNIDNFSIKRSIFPVNVIANMFEAVDRSVATANYDKTSAAYTFAAKATHDQTGKELYVLVVGETSRADNWQLFGYGRETNPKLSVREGLAAYPKTLSESNTTHKSVPMILSPLTAETFGDSIYCSKGICEAFNEAGFTTAFLSNQQRNHSFIDFFANQAQTTEFIKDSVPDALDDQLLPKFRKFIDEADSNKIFIVMHCYGSHFNYHERYNNNYRRFTPDNSTEASSLNRAELINAYDNTILFTDALLDSIISIADSMDIPAALVYTSDHGEDIFDDSRKRFLHASPTTTFTQIHVPLLIWMSEAYRHMFPDEYAAIVSNTNKNVSSTRSVFPTMLSIAGVSSSRVDPSANLSSFDYSESPRHYLNDYNEAVSLDKAGFRQIDFKNAKSNNISTE